MKLTVSRLSLSLCLATSAALLGCGVDQNVPALLESAQKYMAQNDRKAAVIQLKNALQQEPNSAKARLLLGQVLFDDGQIVPAGVEVEKALEYGAPKEQAVPLAARVLLIEGKTRPLVERFGSLKLEQPQAQAQLQALLAQAYMALNDKARGEAALKAALEADPNQVDAQLLKVRMLAMERDTKAALELVETVVKQHPKEHDAWLHKGSLLQESDPAAALEAFRQAIAQRKDSVVAHSSVIGILLGQKKLDEAVAQMAQLKSVQPNHPGTKFLEAQIAMRKGDLKGARELVLPLLKVAPNDLRLLQLAGSIEYESGSLLQAATYLAKALQLAPDALKVRQILAQTQLRMGEAAKVMTTLQPLLDGKPDAPTLALAAQALQQQGELDKAEQMFRRAAALDPSDNRVRAAVAITQLARGQSTGAAMEELATLAAKDEGTTADLALINARMRRNEHEAALKAIDVLEKKIPTQPLPHMLRGRTQLALKQPEQARKSFEAALKADPQYLAAASSLAAMDVQDKQFDVARKRFDAVLKADPRNLQALLTVARIRAAAGAPAPELTKLYEEAIRLNPNEPLPRVTLIEHLVAQKSIDAALGVARDAIAAIPDNPGLLAVMARVQGLSGDTNQAISSLNKLAAQQPNSAEAQLLLADAHVAAKNMDQAIASLQRAQSIAPQDLGVQQRLAMTLLAAGKPAQAMTVARAVQKQKDGELAGHVLEGDLEAGQKHWREAAAAYRTALQKQPGNAGTAVAIRLHSVLVAADKNEATAFASKWLADHASDTAFTLHLGDVAMSQRDYPQAETRFSSVLKARPEDPVALNNLSWVLVQLKKPGAVELAEKANKLRPNIPAFMDTLALALASEKQWDRAIDLQKKAVELDAAKNPSLRLTLARLYLGAEQRGQARTELDTLVKLGKDFKDQDEVAKLLQSL